MSRAFSHTVLLKELAERGRLVDTEGALEIGGSLGGSKASIKFFQSVLGAMSTAEKERKEIADVKLAKVKAKAQADG